MQWSLYFYHEFIFTISFDDNVWYNAVIVAKMNTWFMTYLALVFSPA